MSEQGASSHLIPPSRDWSYRELKEFCGILNGGPSVMSYEEFASPVFVINAIIRSLESGNTEPVGRANV
jgi:hypothetical protein